MPSDTVTLAFAIALLCAAAVWLLALGGLSLKTLWLRIRKPAFATELMHEPGHSYGYHITQALWRAQTSIISLMAALAAGVTVLVLSAPTLDLANWQRIGLVATSAICITLIAVTAALHAWRARDWQQQKICRHICAQNVQRIGGDRDRIFHDVAVGDGSWIDHVLIGVHGAFAIVVVGAKPGRGGIAERQGDRLLLDDDESYVDLNEARQRSTRLQHQLSKSLGRMIKLGTVVALPGWRIRNNTANDMLIVGHRDIVMIKGWRKASDGLMNEDADALQKQLETLTQSNFRPTLGDLAAHSLIVQPDKKTKSPSRSRKTTATA